MMTVEAILNYCKKRYGINPNDISSLIGYDDQILFIF